ncbi:MAG: fumarylacetoacetate hydrolase family protein [Janthinobacterium lividum]
MKLLRYGPAGQERPGLLDATGTLRDLSGQVGDITPDLLSRAQLSALAAIDPASLPAIEGRPRLGVPVAGIGQVVAAGLNYADHAAESGMAVPDEPVLFLKSVSSLAGADDRVALPPGSAKADWEVELGVVIGRTARHVAEADAMEHVAGFCVVNDLSERSFQLERGGTWDKGKGCDGFGPVGPWLVTADEVADPQALELWLDLNGEAMQRGSTRTMVFGVAVLVAYISRFITLRPGDLVITGTPPGVGMGRKPQRFLRAGDVMELGITGLGRQRQEVA